jgi:hypothetical protein
VFDIDVPWVPSIYFCMYYLFLFLFLVVLGFELRASHLLGRLSTIWATLLALVCIIFNTNVSNFLCIASIHLYFLLLIQSSWSSPLKIILDILMGVWEPEDKNLFLFYCPKLQMVSWPDYDPFYSLSCLLSIY